MHRTTDQEGCYLGPRKERHLLMDVFVEVFFGGGWFLGFSSRPVSLAQLGKNLHCSFSKPFQSHFRVQAQLGMMWALPNCGFLIFFLKEQMGMVEGDLHLGCGMSKDNPFAPHRRLHFNLPRPNSCKPQRRKPTVAIFVPIKVPPELTGASKGNLDQDWRTALGLPT